MSLIDQIFAPFQFLLGPDGGRQFLEQINQMKIEYGSEWLDYFKAEYPDFVILVDLAANRTAEEALPLFQAHAIELIDAADCENWMKLGAKLIVPGWCRANAAWLTHMHGQIKTEIDRPRF